jgi:hypothetical protein
MRKRLVIGFAVAAFAVTGLLVVRAAAILPDWARCSPNGELSCSTVDGIALGGFIRSWEADAPPCVGACGEPAEVARKELDLREPDHPTIMKLDEYGADRHVLCGDTLCAVSGGGGPDIFVFVFGDSTSLPIVVLVSCPGIGACRIINGYGPPR